jgi:hypothetical protein
MSRNSTFLRRIYRLPTITNNFFLNIRLLWQVFIKTQAKRRPLAKSPFTMKLGAGTASESVASHYERDELPYTLPCRKIYLMNYADHTTDFILFVNIFFPPSLILRPSTAYDLYEHNLFVVACFLPPSSYLLFIFVCCSYYSGGAKCAP